LRILRPQPEFAAMSRCAMFSGVVTSALTTFWTLFAAAQDPPPATGAITVTASPSAPMVPVVTPPGSVVKPEGIVAFVEGPAWHPNGSVYFSDCANNRIMRRDVAGKMHVYRTPSGCANGLFLDAERRLLACEGAGEGGNRRVTRTEKNGTIAVLTDRYESKHYNAPNDLSIDTKGRIYFTDPRYGDRDGLEMFDEAGKPIFGVYRIDPSPDSAECKVRRILSFEVACPNGLEVSAGDKYLYVVDNDNSKPDGNRKVWRFELTSEGDVVPKSQTLLFDFGRGRGGDGMALDVEGRLYVAAGTNIATPMETTDFKAGIYVLSPEGKLLQFIPVSEDMVTNCTFGAPDRKMLFITAGHKLWSIPVLTPGYVPYTSKLSTAAP
jgi:gluconolactonase